MTYLHRITFLAAIIAPTVGSSVVLAIPPRSERVAARIAERAYARQAIAEARAARAEARVAEIAPLAPVPPPPRPATVRRMARAGVPPVAPPPVIVQSPVVTRPQATTPPVAATSPPTPRPAAAVATAPAMVPPATKADVAEDGTRSVLTTAEEPGDISLPRDPAGGPVTHPPVELLPTPAPE